ANTAPQVVSAPAVTRQQGTLASAAPIATVSDAETTAGSLVVSTTTVPAGITVAGVTNVGGAVSALVGAGCTAVVGPNTVGLSVSDGQATTTAGLTVNVTANTPPTLGTYVGPSLLVGGSAT